MLARIVVLRVYDEHPALQQVLAVCRLAGLHDWLEPVEYQILPALAPVWPLPVAEQRLWHHGQYGLVLVSE